MSIRRTESHFANDYIILASDDDRLIRHDDLLSATTEMNRLALKHKGRNFKLFAQIGQRREPKPVKPPPPKPPYWREYPLIDWAGAARHLATPPPAFPRFFTERYPGQWGGTAYLKFEHANDHSLCYLKNGKTGSLSAWGITEAERGGTEVSRADAEARVTKPAYPRYFKCLKADMWWGITPEEVPLICYVSPTAMKHCRRSAGSAGPLYKWGALSEIANVENVNPLVFREIGWREADTLQARLMRAV